MKNNSKRAVPRPGGSATPDKVGVGEWHGFDFKNGEKVRPPSADAGSVSSRQEITTMDLTAPGNSLAEAVGRLLPLFEEWLKKQVGQVEEVPSVSADATAPPVKEWYSPEEASVVINRTPNHVRELCRGKVFGTHDSGGRWVIHRKELEAFRLGRLKVHGEKFE